LSLKQVSESVVQYEYMNRERLTITLKNEVLKMVDAAIDGKTIRNRSHAIEVLLSQCLLPKSTKVLILAGGKGAHFRPLTYELPKAMIPVKGKPILEHTIQKLKLFNLTDITISVGHLGEKIEEYFGNGAKWGVKIGYLRQEKKNQGTAQPLRQAEELFGKSSFLVLYGDVLAEINLLDLLDFHRSQNNKVCTMALASVDKPSMWGVAKVTGSRVIELDEKPISPKTHSHLVNAGIYVMEPEIFQYIKAKTNRLEKEVFPRLSEEGKLLAYAFEGSWFDVSTPQVYEQVLKEWKGF